MMYVIMAVLGAAVGWYVSSQSKTTLSLPLSIGVGVAGGLLGGLIATAFTFAAVVLFKLILAAAGAYILIYAIQQFMKK